LSLNEEVKKVTNIDLQHLIVHLIIIFGIFLPPGALIFMRPDIVAGMPLALWVYWIFAYIYLVVHYFIWAMRRERAARSVVKR